MLLKEMKEHCKRGLNVIGEANLSQNSLDTGCGQIYNFFLIWNTECGELMQINYPLLIAFPMMFDAEIPHG